MNWTLVTGAAKGLGAAISKALAEAGHSLVLHYKTSEKEVLELKKECESMGVTVQVIQGDFSNRESTQDFLGRLRAMDAPIKYLVNNVGTYLIESLSKTPEDDWYALFETNLHAPFLLFKGLSDAIESQKGRILHIGVTGLNTRPTDVYSPAYSIAKGALLSLTRSLAKELAPLGVTVNMISPGYLETSIDLPENPSHLPMGRAIALDEIAAMVIYLFSNKAKNITGQNIEISGGVRL